MYTELEKEIKNINDYSDSRRVQQVRNQLLSVNTNDPSAKKLLEIAYKKNLI